MTNENSLTRSIKVACACLIKTEIIANQIVCVGVLFVTLNKKGRFQKYGN